MPGETLERMPQLKKLEQISEETGISVDYFNVYGHFPGLIKEAQNTAKTSRRDVDECLEKILRDSLYTQEIPAYTKRYPAEQYLDVVTEQNRKNIEALDILAQQMNRALSRKPLSSMIILDLVQRAARLIFGETTIATANPTDENYQFWFMNME